MIDGVYRRHPLSGDEEHHSLPNQRDWGTPGRRQRSHFKRSRRTDIERNGSEREGSARVRERLEAHGDPRDREYNVLFKMYVINAVIGLNPH